MNFLAIAIVKHKLNFLRNLIFNLYRHKLGLEVHSTKKGAKYNSYTLIPTNYF
jgi:hypothetical protein